MPGQAVIRPAAVLRCQPVGEHDLIVAVLTPDAGRIDVAARGARRSQKRFSPAIMRPFVELELTVGPPRGGGLPQLAAATLLADLLGPAPTYPQLALGSYIVELASLFAEPGHADVPLYRWLVACLGHAGVCPEAQLADAALLAELTVLQTAGLLADLARCVRCGRGFDGPGWWPNDGEGIVCGHCSPDAPLSLTAPQLRALDAAVRAIDPAPLQQLPAAAKSLASARSHRQLRGHLPGPLRAQSALRDLLPPWQAAAPAPMPS